MSVTLAKALVEARIEFETVLDGGCRNGAFTPGAEGARTVEANNRRAYADHLLRLAERIKRLEAELEAESGHAVRRTAERSTAALERVQSAAIDAERAMIARDIRILEAVNAFGLSARAVAKAAGISHTQVQRIIAKAQS